jgi:hypothetical protein
MSLPDFMSLLDEPEDIEPEVLLEPAAPDFMSAEDEPAPVPELVAGDEPDVLLLPVCGLAAGDEVEPDVPDDLVSVLVLGLADGAFVSLPVLAGVFVSVLEPLPPVDVPLAPALDDEPVADPLAPLAPPPWANADVASIAPATVSAKALIHVFITVLLLLCGWTLSGAGSAGLASVRHLPHFLLCGGRFDTRESRQRHRTAVTRGAIDGFDDAHIL